MTYTPTTWVNGGAPALNATNLNHIEAGIAGARRDLTLNIQSAPYNAACDGVADDTAALQAAINSVATTAGVPACTLIIPGTVRITDTITITQRAITLAGAGIGNPTNYTTAPGQGSTIRWDGAAGVPMFTITDARNVVVRDLYIQGNITNRPSDGFFFSSAGGTIGTNERITFSNVVIGTWPWTTPTTTGARALDYGIRFGGTNANNDQMHLDNVEFSNCGIAGLALPNTQSIWGKSNNCFFNDCAIGVKTSASHALDNATFVFCGIDIQVDSTAHVWVNGWFSEMSSKLFDISTNGGLCVDGGIWTLASPLEGVTNMATAPALIEGLTLKNLMVNQQTTSTPKIYVRAAYSFLPIKITIQDCRGLSAANLDIQGYAVAGYTYVDIDTTGLIAQTTITDKALGTYTTPQIKTSAGSYDPKDGETQPIICNASTMYVYLPDATAVRPGWTRFTVKNIYSGGDCRVYSYGGAIDGATYVTLAQWSSITIISDGTQWLTI